MYVSVTSSCTRRPAFLKSRRVPRTRCRCDARSPSDDTRPAVETNGVVLVETGMETLLFDASGHWTVEPNGKSQLHHQTRRLSDAAKGLFVPTGYPKTVSADYLPYQLWTLPTHVTGWVSASLATSSMLRAVGVGSSAIPATAVAASIKWITKDGVGALGRLFVGGRLGLYIDQHPRLWRMAAEVISTVGLSLEIATVFFPSQFLLLAGTGNFAKALAKGMAKPSFRVIQQHFARNNNIGEVSAKEESWEVAGQLTGLLTSVAILTSLQDTSSWEPILVTWAIFHSIHVTCRFIALRSLQFDSLSLIRSKILIQMYLTGQTLANPAALAQKQQFLTDWLSATPSIEFGSSLKHISERLLQNARFAPWVDVYRDEGYLLFVEEGHGFVVLKQGGGAQHCLKALWQFLWLQHHQHHQHHHWTPRIDAFHQSLRETNLQFSDFLAQLEEAGWNPQSLVYRLKTTRVSQIGTGSVEKTSTPLM